MNIYIVGGIVAFVLICFWTQHSDDKACIKRLNQNIKQLTEEQDKLFLENVMLKKDRSDVTKYLSAKNQLLKRMQLMSDDIKNLTDDKEKLILENNTLRKQNANLYIEKDKLSKKNDNLQNILQENSLQYPWLAKEYADFIYIFDEITGQNLLAKTRPAIRAAQQVQHIAREKKELQRLCKMQEYQLNYYETVFPWLEDVKESNIYEVWEATKQTNDTDEQTEYDTLKKWLSPEEYQNLSVQKKYQLALDRYKKRKKTNWEIGIEFERYIGYKFEMAGSTVKYNGAIKGLEDMGRDLIVESHDRIRIVQCKRWAKEKTIHEKHIFQLYGSVVMMKITNPSKPLEGLFITTAPLSTLAQQCADYLHIRVKYIDPALIEERPLIKCNISRRDQTKIYHLPFDQQYDTVRIEPEKGEFYAKTIEEAETAGFRRAWRHIPQ